MTVRLDEILDGLSRLPLAAPASDEALFATINDYGRDLGLAPLGRAGWDALLRDRPNGRRLLAWIAFALGDTSLWACSRGTRLAGALESRLTGFLLAAEAMEPEHLAGNAFRRAELVRKWLAHFKLPIAGESAAQSQRALAAVDSAELKKQLAEQQKGLETKRRQWLEEIARAEAANRSNYE